ncbi:MAG: NAD(P)/FAD-dependent oxidoreductase [Candidatus Delongbacteria bacterium]|nr:NAD(P)/FAD-dependent oxidoreductase [Candidatus Delongbacteria bacterium]MBN2834752.1 NAD(P)/FAD-dependent oxidoreductase [Candidatus Delongbacteria bacterium]
MSKTEYNVIIVGAGIAGVTAAIQLRKIGIDFLLLEKHKVGGLINDIYAIENYPGFPDPIQGVKFAELLEEHLNILNIKPTFDNVTRVDYDQDSERFLVKTESTDYFAKYLILATGSSPIFPVNYSEYPEDLKNRTFFTPRDINTEGTTIIVGGGPTSYDYAMTLSSKGSVIFLEINDSELPYYYQLKRLSLKKNIKLITGVHIKKVTFKDNKVVVNAVYGNKKGTVKGDRIFYSKGRVPDTSILSNHLFDFSQRLNREHKLFYIGDCYHGDLRYLTVSAGDGIKAAKLICREMRFNKLFQF